MLNRETVEKLAVLARISLTEDEIQKYQNELSIILEYVETLRSVDTEGLAEVTQVTGLLNVQREDTPILTENREGILAEAPELKNDYFKVKAIF